MILTRTVAPAADLVSLAEAKAHCRVEASDDDALIAGYVEAASALLDGPGGRVGRALVQQTWQAECGALTGRTPFRFPVVPLIALSSISYYDRDNASQSLSAGSVTVYKEDDRAWMVPDIGTAWPAMYARPDAITVTWTAGYGTASDVPQNIAQAARLLIGHWYENREGVVVGTSASQLPEGVDDLIGLSRLGWIAA